LRRGSAFIRPLENVYTEEEQLELEGEDKTKVRWLHVFRQRLGHFLPFKVYGAYIAEKGIDAYVSQFSSPKSGQSSFIPAEYLHTCPTRHKIIDRLNREHKEGTLKKHPLNSCESPLYVGSPKTANTTKPIQDKMSIHYGDGDALNDGSTLFTFCRGVTSYFHVVENPSNKIKSAILGEKVKKKIKTLT
jgi:hypothetical protein